MFSLPYQLSRAFAFSGIERVGWTRPFKWLPVLAALLVGSVFLFLPSKPPLTGGDGLCRLLELVFSVLPGFFIAALAAVATFGKQELDYEMPDPAPTIILRVEKRRRCQIDNKNVPLFDVLVSHGNVSDGTPPVRHFRVCPPFLQNSLEGLRYYKSGLRRLDRGSDNMCCCAKLVYV